MPSALRPRAAVCNSIRRAATRGSDTPVPGRSKARGAMPRVRSITVIGQRAHPSQSRSETKARVRRDTSAGGRPWPRHCARRSLTSSRWRLHSGPRRAESHSRISFASPGARPPVEIETSRSPRRTMAGDMEIAQCRHVLDIDEDPVGARPRGQTRRGRSFDAGDIEDMEALELGRGVQRHCQGLDARLRQRAAPALQRVSGPCEPRPDGRLLEHDGKHDLLPWHRRIRGSTQKYVLTSYNARSEW